MTKRNAALFDLDGVIIDTEPIYTRIWDDINRRFPTGIEDFTSRIKGTTMPDILNKYYPDPETQNLVRTAHYKAEEDMEYPLFDGVITFLTELKKAGIPTAVVTSSNDAKMERLFRVNPVLRTYFDAIITDSMVSVGKPAPECFLTGAKALGVHPADCYVFEDSFNGLKAGRAAGATVIALATTNPRESLEPLADFVLDSFEHFSVADMQAISRR